MDKEGVCEEHTLTRTDEDAAEIMQLQQNKEFREGLKTKNLNPLVLERVLYC